MGNFMRGKGCWGSMMNYDELKASQISGYLLQRRLNTETTSRWESWGWADSYGVGWSSGVARLEHHCTFLFRIYEMLLAWPLRIAII